MMKRREFITLLGGAAAKWPLAAQAQQSGKLATIGLLGGGSASLQTKWTAAFLQRLRELGWMEGSNIAIEYRWTEGSYERAATFAAELVGLKVDVIVTSGTPIIVAAKRATAIVPIVFAAAADPLGGGLVASLARPGGNVTGLSLQSSDLVGKRLELLREVVPRLNRLAVMASAGSPAAMWEMDEVQTAARTLGLETATFEIRRTEDFAVAFETMKSYAQGLYVATDPLMTAHQVRINTLALSMRLPTMHGIRNYVEVGGLMSYGASFPALWRRAGDYVDKILRGAKPAELPVEQPTKFDLTINLVTAKALGLEVPPMLLARADEVIE
jgi:putative tryptophan/tyrosine transport system substrate-binding protein